MRGCAEGLSFGRHSVGSQRKGAIIITVYPASEMASHPHRGQLQSAQQDAVWAK